MLVIRDTSVVPQTGWRYTIKETNNVISTRNYVMLYPMIRQHCLSNNLPVPTEQDVIRSLCENLNIPCYEDEGRVPLINKFSLGIPNAPSLGSCCR